jgi:hypothetical protein
MISLLAGLDHDAIAKRREGRASGPDWLGNGGADPRQPRSEGSGFSSSEIGIENVFGGPPDSARQGSAQGEKCQP